MLQNEVRINQLFGTLHKTLKAQAATTINLQLCSENAKICAYNGIKHTIESVLKNIQNMHLREYMVTTKYTYFKVKTAHSSMYIFVYMHQKDNKIIFTISNKANYNR